MRLLLIVAAYAALTVSAFAETPREIRVPIDGVIQLQVGETRFFDFPKGITRVEVPTENIVEISPRSETTYSFKGATDGFVIATFRATDGHEVSRLQIIVGPHQVRIYGLAEEPDYVGFPCDRLGCAAGTSASGRNKPTSQSTTVRIPTGGGGFIERTKTY